MNILIVGSGQGSWQMRGVQLGAALGARVVSTPTDHDWTWADVAILVKHAGRLYASRVHARGIPLVWDALDFWRQPDQNGVPEAEARRLLGELLAAIRPTLTIGATGAMAHAVDGVFLPHHSRIGLRPTPAREEFRVIGYDGNGAYLGRWAPALTALCQSRGWEFRINPPDLSTCDLLVALRDGPWDGWMCREWKSGVKLGNAIAAGRPVITQPTASFRELHPFGGVIEDIHALPRAVDRWLAWSARQAIAEFASARVDAYSVESVAGYYREILSRAMPRSEATC